MGITGLCRGLKEGGGHHWVMYGPTTHHRSGLIVSGPATSTPSSLSPKAAIRRGGGMGKGWVGWGGQHPD